MSKHSLYHPNGAIFWSGPSRIDGQPIVAIATGLFNPSCNPKTGVMHQTWILRSDIHPYEALHTGADVSICGICLLKLDPVTGKRLCYVNSMTLGQVYRSYVNNKYPIVKIAPQSKIWFDLKPLRIGAYGDPAAIPIEIWTDWLKLLAASKIGHTGYTRRWMLPENQEFRTFLMASVFNDAEQQQAQGLGWRTYRVLSLDAVLPDFPEEKLRQRAIVCPGSKEGGYAKTCRECLMCDGTNGKSSVVTYAHGYNGKLFAN